MTLILVQVKPLLEQIEQLHTEANQTINGYLDLPQHIRQSVELKTSNNPYIELYKKKGDVNTFNPFTDHIHSIIEDLAIISQTTQLLSKHSRSEDLTKKYLNRKDINTDVLSPIVNEEDGITYTLNKEGLINLMFIKLHKYVK